jgi:hypothetical protein
LILELLNSIGFKCFVTANWTGTEDERVHEATKEGTVGLNAGSLIIAAGLGAAENNLVRLTGWLKTERTPEIILSMAFSFDRDD